MPLYIIRPIYYMSHPLYVQCIIPYITCLIHYMSNVSYVPCYMSRILYVPFRVSDFFFSIICPVYHMSPVICAIFYMSHPLKYMKLWKGHCASTHISENTFYSKRTRSIVKENTFYSKVIVHQPTYAHAQPTRNALRSVYQCMCCSRYIRAISVCVGVLVT